MYKARVQVEAFSGKTAVAVKRDIYAKIKRVSLCESLAFPIEEKVIKERLKARRNGEAKHHRKNNRTYAYRDNERNVDHHICKEQNKSRTSRIR
jgi:hypothetical protein